MDTLRNVLQTRDTAESDTKGDRSRLVLTLIGSAMLVVIVVCLLLQPLRRIQ